MPPKRTTDGGSSVARGRPKSSTAGKKSVSKTAAAPPSSNRFGSSDEDEEEEGVEEEEEEDARRGDDDRPEKRIPDELLTRLLHEFFTKDATRISKDANAAVGKYVDVFVREAIARTAVEKRGGFLEVEDLEKVTPQLLLDL